MTDEVRQEDREAVNRAEAYAKSLDTTPEECHDIMAAVRLAKRFMRRSPLRDRIAVLEGALGTIANHDLVGASTQYLALQSIARAALNAAGGKQ